MLLLYLVNVVTVILKPSVADPDSGSVAFLTPGSGIKKKSGSGSRMINADHISESLETIFWDKIFKFFYAYLGWKYFGSGMEKFRLRDLG